MKEQKNNIVLKSIDKEDIDSLYNLLIELSVVSLLESVEKK